MYLFDQYIPYTNYYKNTFTSLQNNNLVAFGKFINKDFIIVAPYASYSSASYIIVDVSQSTFIPSNVIPSNLQPYQFYIINNNVYNMSNINQQVLENQINAFMQYYDIVTQSQSSATVLANNGFNLLSNINSAVNSIYTSITLLGKSIEPIYLNFSGDVLNWPTTYSLSLYQSLIISFTNSRKFYIPLQLTGSDIYDVYFTQNVNSYTSGAIPVATILYPNNQSASIIYAEAYVEYNSGTFLHKIDIGYYGAFRICSSLGSSEAVIINNSPFTKTVIYRDVELGNPYDPQASLPGQIWLDYTTPWTMLGTLLLSQTASGYLVIQRRA